MEWEEYFFDASGIDEKQGQVFVLIIYDIVDNKQRVRFAKYLQGYGDRVQKSAFEARISKQKYKKLLREIPDFVTKEDSIRVYRIQGKGQISTWGIDQDIIQEDVIVI